MPRLEDGARELGHSLELVDSVEVVGASGDPSVREIPLTEPLTGSDAYFLRYVVDSQPALLIFDLTSSKLPWGRWIQVLKTSAATRRVPVLAFGPHIDKERLETASRAGADRVVSRGKFQASFAELISEMAREVDASSLRETCQGSLSDLGEQGLVTLNKGEYYEAHEYLEQAWMEAPELEGYLYRALLQVSVAYLHITRDNYRGAAKMLLRLKQWLEPLPERCRGVDIGQLKAQVTELQSELDRLGEEHLSELDRDLLHPIPLVR